MSNPNINVLVGGPEKSNASCAYKTVALKNSLSFASQIIEQNTKYVVKFDYDLGGASVTIPTGCILYFDGGTVRNGTLVGQDTLIVNVGDIDILGNTVQEGTWRVASVTVDDALSDTSENPVQNKVVKAALDSKQDTIDEEHKLDYSLLNNTPEIPIVPAISTDISADATSDTKTASPKAVKTYTDGKVVEVLGSVSVQIEEQDTTIRNAINQQNTAIQNKFASQDAAISQLNGNEVVVIADHTSVSEPDSQKIYRQYGTDSYTDWMYQNGAWRNIATYSMPGIDVEPTAGSENLVKSGGVYELTKDLFEKEVNINIPKTEYYIDTNFNEVSFWNGACSDYIPVKKGDTLLWNTVNSTAARIVGYDANKQNPVLVHESGGSGLNICIVKDVAYIRASANDNDSSKYLKVIHNDTYNEVKDELSEVIENNYYDLLDVNTITGKYIAGNGAISDVLGGKYRDIKVYKGTKIIINAGTVHATSTVIGKKIDTTYYTPLVLGSAISSYPYEYVCEEDMVVGVCFYYGTQEIRVITTTNYAKSAAGNVESLWEYNEDKADETTVQDITYGYMFDKIAVIGDSLSSGRVEGIGEDVGSDYLKYSWLSHLSKRWNCTSHFHYSGAGLNTQTWIDNWLSVLQNDPIVYDCYFIALGTNNEPEAPDTEGLISRYNQILNAVRAKAPHAAIFMVSLYEKRPENSVLEGIANSRMPSDKGLYYIDYANKAKYLRYSPETNWKGHFSTTGYVYVASAINQIMNEVIWDNKTETFWQQFASYHSL